jgi:predicted RNA-binding Zn-ribbon protein involved in translation (DUF1610 family)
MPISFECHQCGRKLKAPDAAAGKASKCPSCGAKVVCPQPVYDAEVEDRPAGVDPYSDLDDGTPYALKDPDPAPAPEAGEGARRPCPMCGEMILTTAAKCRYCGEVFDPTLKKAKSKKALGAGAEDLSTGDIVVALLCSGIGCIAGLVWMIQGKPKGMKMFGLSFVMVIVWGVINAFLQSTMRQAGIPGGP